MEPLGNIIKKDALGQDASPQLEDSTNKFLAMKYWEEVVTAFLAESKGKSQAIAVENNTLIIACLSEDIAKDIAELQETFIDGVNRLLGHDYIEGIRLEL